MVRLHGRVEVARPPEAVFDLLNRVGDWPRWWSACQSAEAAGEGLSAGDAVEARLTPHKMTYTLLAVVDEVRPGRSITFSVRKKGVAASLEWRIEPIEEGSVVNEILTLSGPGLIFFRLAGQVEALANMVKRNLNAFKNFAERDD